MARVILSTTTVTSIVGSDIDILTYYDGSLPDINLAFLGSESGSRGGTAYVEGDGVVDYNELGVSSLFVYLDESTGDVYIDSVDSSNYSIDAQTGQLQYTT